MTRPTLLKVRIFGHPVPWSHPRAKRLPFGIQFFEQPEQVDWKRTVVAQVLPVKPETPSDNPLCVRAIFFVQRPMSAPKRVRYPAKKPDCSNLIKSLEDCLNGIVWKDDSRIVDLIVSKRFDERPGVLLEVTELLGGEVEALPNQEALAL